MERAGRLKAEGGHTPSIRTDTVGCNFLHGAGSDRVRESRAACAALLRWQQKSGMDHDFHPNRQCAVALLLICMLATVQCESVKAARRKASKTELS